MGVVLVEAMEDEPQAHDEKLAEHHQEIGELEAEDGPDQGGVATVAQR